MKNKKLDAIQIWKQFEDYMVPRLELSVVDRAVYSHLVRHSRLEGKLRLSFSMAWLARGTRLSTGGVRPAVRQLIAKGALRLVERTKAGHVVEVKLPEDIRGCQGMVGSGPGCSPRGVSLEETDFWETKALREAIHERERGRCFYCLGRVTGRTRCLDHVVPQVQMGSNSYRNLVSSCMECNAQKGEMPAEDFLRWLCRERRLTSAELADRLRKLDALAAGELRPVLPALPHQSTVGARFSASQSASSFANPLPRKPRPTYHPENLGAFSRPGNRR